MVRPLILSAGRPAGDGGVFETLARTMLPSRLRRRFVMIGILMVGAIAVADWLVIGMARNASIEAYAIADTNIARGMNAQTFRALDGVDKVLQGLLAALITGDVVSPDSARAALVARSTFDLLGDSQKRLPGVEALALVDAGGRIANSSRGWPSVGIDVSNRDFFRHFVDNADPTPFVNAPARDNAGAWSSFIARRIVDAHGDFAGVILAELSLGDLEEFYHVAMPPRRTVTVMRRDGTVLVQYPHVVDRTGEKPAGEAWYALAAGGGGTYHGADFLDNAPVVAAVLPMGDMPLLIEASSTEAEVLAGWIQQRLWLIVGGVFASLGALLLLRLFSAQIHRLEASQLSLAATNIEVETAHSQLDAALSNIPQGLCFFDSDHRLIFSNRRYGEIYRLAAEAIEPGATAAAIFDRCCAAVGIVNYTRSEYLKSLEDTARNSESHHSTIELKDGRTIAVQQQPMPDGGWVATHEDITERRRAVEKIAFLARHDGLTGLANRSLLRERIDEALVGAAQGACFALLFLDLDRFKAVNDALGHGAGDELLCEVAARLTATVSKFDTVARLGGDEFVVLQAGRNTPEDTAHLARRIIKLVGAPYHVGGREVVIGVSIGVDISPKEPTSADILIMNADKALYMAKAEGRGTFRFFEPEMNTHTENPYRQARDPRRAVEKTRVA
jgi:diguanylate cyclase (GGDEF)-like protein